MKCIKWLNVIQGLFVALALVSTVEARVTTFAWDANSSWPSGTTIELEANGATANSITGTQYTLDVPVQPGGIIDARARAIPPAGYQCGDPVGTCPPSGWATLVQTMPATPIGLWATKALQEGGTTMALSLSVLTSGSSTSNPATTASISPTAGRKWLAVMTASVLGGYNTNAGDSFAVSGAGLTWTQLSRVATWGSRRALYVFRGDGTPSSGALTLTFTSSIGLEEQLKWAIVELDGIDTTTPYGTTYTNSSSFGTAASVTVSETPDAGDFILFLHGQEDNNTDTLNSELDTSLIRIGDSTGARRFGISYDSAPDSTPAPGVTWTGSCSWGAIGFVLNVGAGGGSQALAGNAAAVASATGAATMAIPVTAASAIIATAVGNLLSAIPLQAAAEIVAVATGGVTMQVSMAASALAEALSSGVIGMALPLAGDAASEAAATGDVTLSSETDLSGDAVIQATASGGLEHTTDIAGDAASEAAGTGDLTTGSETDLSAAPTIEASATGTLEHTTSVAGDAGVEATGTGTITLTTTLAGSAIAEALAAAGLTMESALAAQAAVEASGTGAVVMTTGLAGGATAEATGAADVGMALSLAGAAAGEVTATGDVTVLAEGDLAGAAVVSASASGQIGTTIPLAGDASIIMVGSGLLDAVIPIAGAANVVVLTTGDLELSIQIDLAGAATTVADGSGSIFMTVPLSSSALVEALVTATMSGGIGNAVRLGGYWWVESFTPSSMLNPYSFSLIQGQLHMAAMQRAIELAAVQRLSNATLIS